MYCPFLLRPLVDLQNTHTHSIHYILIIKFPDPGTKCPSSRIGPICSELSVRGTGAQHVEVALHGVEVNSLVLHVDDQIPQLQDIFNTIFAPEKLRIDVDGQGTRSYGTVAQQPVEVVGPAEKIVAFALLGGKKGETEMINTFRRPSESLREKCPVLQEYLNIKRLIQ